MAAAPAVAAAWPAHGQPGRLGKAPSGAPASSLTPARATALCLHISHPWFGWPHRPSPDEGRLRCRPDSKPAADPRSRGGFLPMTSARLSPLPLGRPSAFEPRHQVMARQGFGPNARPLALPRVRFRSPRVPTGASASALNIDRSRPKPDFQPSPGGGCAQTVPSLFKERCAGHRRHQSHRRELRGCSAPAAGLRGTACRLTAGVRGVDPDA